MWGLLIGGLEAKRGRSRYESHGQRITLGKARETEEYCRKAIANWKYLFLPQKAVAIQAPAGKSGQEEMGTAKDKKRRPNVASGQSRRFQI
jgi:hypothetical protein